ncbi:hypothetical protein KIPB_006627 [Kipferlia bialata]|uniref:Uncharacterized protein n=1 Tax=Kipferlia bialata TaxID=797122 RepID=A0A9K3CT09_9EUKA|nr:hypothetical protein KIPB_003489 [Kipferlia bialata]GIQ85020.1 hypothetical protein KIPB_006627 [Kipferlia bialata]|eukprot:g3489.t1
MPDSGADSEVIMGDLGNCSDGVYVRFTDNLDAAYAADPYGWKQDGACLGETRGDGESGTNPQPSEGEGLSETGSIPLGPDDPPLMAPDTALDNTHSPSPSPPTSPSTSAESLSTPLSDTDFPFQCRTNGVTVHGRVYFCSAGSDDNEVVRVHVLALDTGEWSTACPPHRPGPESNPERVSRAWEYYFDPDPEVYAAMREEEDALGHVTTVWEPFGDKIMRISRKGETWLFDPEKEREGRDDVWEQKGSLLHDGMGASWQVCFVADNTVHLFWHDSTLDRRGGQVFTEATGWSLCPLPLSFPTGWQEFRHVRVGTLFVSFFEAWGDDTDPNPQLESGLGCFDSVSQEWRTLFPTSFMMEDVQPLALMPDDDDLRFLIYVRSPPTDAYALQSVYDHYVMYIDRDMLMGVRTRGEALGVEGD